ncbi:DUF2160 domain-containing protein [Mangrovicoccus ximenensis]|uniref:DUF2160 domain-containing protein n=1 Tax=Mangrovicoccus ximenensis TaxID=1911570 RepID=UPI000D3ABEC8|nr:DUF2160 domain-containing protein [Mangrovicoccus ximenensis]
MDFQWMAWTTPTAVFFLVIAAILVAMTLAEIRFPTAERRGFLPMPTTRGDRLFLSLMLAAFIHLGFVALSDAQSLAVPLGISIFAGALMMRFG